MPTPAHAPAGCITGILLAAGRGRRMGRTKQLLPWPPDSRTPLVAVSFDTVSPVCHSMIVIVGHEAAAVAGALSPRVFTPVQSDPDAPMLESIRAGLRAALVRSPGTGILLHPADHPTVRPGTLEFLIGALRGDPARAHMPEYRGKGGHPVLIPSAVAAAILDSAGDGGLRQFWLDHPHLCARHCVNDPGVAFDIDTPPDYQSPRVPT